jgi:hypothetical protein
MTRGGLLAVQRDMMPTRSLLDPLAIGRHTESSGTLCSVTVQTLIQWCRASRPHQAVPSPRKDRRMSSQEVRVGRVHVLLPVVLQAFLSTVCLITHEHSHEPVLSCQQVHNADRCPLWRWW